MSAVYLDHAATTPIADEVLNHLTSLYKTPVANSSSSHTEGIKALALLNQARAQVAQKLGCEADEVYFTSGGTEGNNWIIQRTILDAYPHFAKESRKPHLLTSSIEHSSVTNVAEWLSQNGFAEWSQLPVDSYGFVLPEVLEKHLKPNTVLVSIVHGNNEIGTIQKLESLGAICRKHDVLFHTDACQSFCHTGFTANALPVDFMTLSGHKIRGPKGVGAVYIRRGIELSALFLGGKQERGLRPGTTSVELASAFAAATAVWNDSVVKNVQEIRSYAIQSLTENIPGVIINGAANDSLCHVLSFTVPDVNSNILHKALAETGVACSTGAACGTGKSNHSAVLLALGRDETTAHQIRISFSPSTQTQTIDLFMEQLTKVLKALAAK
ncbi:MAG: cysteine desulfurase family protein [Bdellovibrionales bacterium]|jgi:cysteine desulfurase|nr:cysteine desulfurase family protein [Bdellovibrionales bacterium]